MEVMSDRMLGLCVHLDQMVLGCPVVIRILLASICTRHCPHERVVVEGLRAQICTTKGGSSWVFIHKALTNIGATKSTQNRGIVRHVCSNRSSSKCSRAVIALHHAVSQGSSCHGPHNRGIIRHVCADGSTTNHASAR